MGVPKMPASHAEHRIARDPGRGTLAPDLFRGCNGDARGIVCQGHVLASLDATLASASNGHVADAHAELPKVTTPTEPPQWFGPTRMNPEKITEVVPDASQSETLSPPSARDPEGETRAMSNGVIDGESRTESRPELRPRATDREPAAELSAEETTAGPLPALLALLLIALGLSTVAGSLIL